MISRDRQIPLQIGSISLIAGLISGANWFNKVYASIISNGFRLMAVVLGIKIGFVEVNINSQEGGGMRGLTWSVLKASSRIKIPL